MDDERMKEIVRMTGKRYGFTDVDATISPFRDLKMRWVRCAGTVDFDVSDYMREAPEDVFEGLMDCIFRRMKGSEYPEYPRNVRDWLESKEFRALNQDTFIERSRHIDTGADTSALERSYRRLVDAGLVGEIDGLRLFWSDNDIPSKAAEGSCLMRVVSVNLKMRDAPDEALDYCLLYQLSNILEGLVVTGDDRAEKVTVILDSYPDRDDVRKWLEERGVVL